MYRSIVIDEDIAIGLLQGSVVAITFPSQFHGRHRNDVLTFHRMRSIVETHNWLTALNDDFQGLKRHYGIGCIDDMAAHEIPQWVPNSISRAGDDVVSDVTDEIDDIFQDEYYCGFAQVSTLCVNGTLASFVCSEYATDIQNYLMPNVRTRMNFVLDVVGTLVRLYKYSISPKLEDKYFDAKLSSSSIFISEHFHAKLGRYTTCSFEDVSSPDIAFKSTFFSSPERFQQVVKRDRRSDSKSPSVSSDADDVRNEPAHAKVSWRVSFMNDISKSWVFSLAMVSYECLTQTPVFSKAINDEIEAGFARDVATLRVQSNMVEKGLRPHIPREWSEGGDEAMYVKLISDSWKQNPSDRPTIHEFERRLRALIQPDKQIPKPEKQVRFRRSLGLGPILDKSNAPPASATLAPHSSESDLKNTLTKLHDQKSTASTLGEKEPWEFTFEPDNLVRCLGQGAVGEVWQYRLDGALVALKRVKNDTRNAARSKKVLETFRREVTKMLNLRHPNIVSFCGACLLEQSPCIALELARGGDLRHNLHRIDDEPKALHVFKGVTAGLKYLHDRRIVHRDIKVDNILVAGRITEEVNIDFATWSVKISDFGWADSADTLLVKKKVKGIPYWFAPEMLTSHRYSWPVDIYAIGILIWEVLMKETPFSKYERHEFMRVVGIDQRSAEILLSYIQHRKYSPTMEAVLAIMCTCLREAKKTIRE